MSAQPDPVAEAAKVIFALHLSEGLSVVKAAAAAGVKPFTGYQWKKDPVVTTELARIQSETKLKLLRRLASYGSLALDVYHRAMTDSGERPVSRSAATVAKDVLDRLGLDPKALGDYLGSPDEPVTIVLPLPIVADAREQQEERRRLRVERQQAAGLLPMEQGP